MPRPKKRNNATSLDVLRLSSNEVAAINHELDLIAEQFQGDNRRQDERHPYQGAAQVVVTVFHPGGTTTRYLIRLRNISRTGLGFLHGSFLHLGTQLIVSLETLRHTLVNVPGQIVHCKFVRGNVHEIGVRFTNPIELSQFVLEENDHDPSAGLPHLIGRVLCIENDESDRELLRFIFDRLGVQNALSATVDEAIDKLNNGMSFDVVMVSVDAHADVADTMKRLRAAAPDLPTIAMTCNEKHPQEDKLNGELANWLMVKPLDAHAVAMALLQHLPVTAKPDEGDDATLYSALWSDQSIRPLVLEYLNRLAEQVAKLRNCFQDGADPKEAAKLCNTIKGSAGSYGYPQISDAAKELRQLVETGETGANAGAQLDALQQMCDAACRVRTQQNKAAA